MEVDVQDYVDALKAIIAQQTDAIAILQAQLARLQREDQTESEPGPDKEGR